MDRNSIKDNGILEQYLLGELSNEQSMEVAQLLKNDDELREYLGKLENDFEQLAFENAINPPAHIKKSLMDIVEKQEAVNDEDAKVIPIRTKKSNPLSFAIAASFAGIFLISSAWFYYSFQNTKGELRSLQNEATVLRNQVTRIEENFNETNKWYQAINQPDAIQLVLKGNEILPNSTAISYINHKDKTVILNTRWLPKLEDDKDYQMWADVEGVMIDMGVIPSDKQMVEMKYINAAESLNITIEPKGGNDHPTVERLISNVYL